MTYENTEMQADKLLNNFFWSDNGYATKTL